jgi:hypothetical protein
MIEENMDWINAARESIAQKRLDNARLSHLRERIIDEKNEYEKLVAGMKEPGVSERDLAAISEVKQDFERAIIRKSQEIIPLLEVELGMYQKDLEATERNLLKQSNSEPSSNTEVVDTFREQVNYLQQRVDDKNKEIDSYKNIILEIEAKQSQNI